MFFFNRVISSFGINFSSFGFSYDFRFTFTVFSNNEHNIDSSLLDPTIYYCAMANLHSTLGKEMTQELDTDLDEIFEILQGFKKKWNFGKFSALFAPFTINCISLKKIHPQIRTKF